MNREGVARWPALLELPKRSPRPSPAADRGPPPAIRLACLPSAAAPRPRPLRCGLVVHRARRVKAAQVVGGSWWVRARRSEAESLDRCATLRQPHGGSVVKTV
jgi:hypothetical protein